MMQSKTSDCADSIASCTEGHRIYYTRTSWHSDSQPLHTTVLASPCTRQLLHITTTPHYNYYYHSVIIPSSGNGVC